MNVKAKQKRGPNWSKREMLRLLDAWGDIVQGPKVKGKKAAHTDTRIYQRFVDLHDGASTRTEKAIKGKRKRLSTAYKLVCDFNNNMKRGSTGRPNLFEFTEGEQEEIKQANTMAGRITGMDRDIFAAVSRVLGDNDSLNLAILISTTSVAEGDR